MLNKENNLIFLQAIQEKQFEKAYRIGEQILIKNPNEQSIKRFMIFLQNNLQNQEEDDADEEDVKEIGHVQKIKKQNKQPQYNSQKTDKTQSKNEPKNTLDVKNKQIIISNKTLKQKLEIRNLKQTKKIQIQQFNKPSEVLLVKSTVPQISIQFPSLRRK